MDPKLQKIRNKIFRKEKEADVIDSWNYLMLHYGWIPFNEFLKIEAYLVNELIKRLNELNEKNNSLVGGKFKKW